METNRKRTKGCFSDFLQNSTTIMMIFNTLSLTNYVLARKNLTVISMGLSVLQLSSSKKAQKSSVQCKLGGQDLIKLEYFDFPVKNERLNIVYI